MSEIHLSDLRSQLENNHWIISNELNGNDYDISGVWEIETIDKKYRFSILFEGLEETGVLPLNKSYGCRVKEHPEIRAYFSRKSRSWPNELNEFIVGLKNIRNDKNT